MEAAKPTRPALCPFQALVPAPGFALGLSCTVDAITGIEFLPPEALSASAPGPATPQNPLAREAVRQLTAYLADPDQHFDLPLAPAGTPFRRRVWSAIAAIPLGQTQSYGQLAQQLQNAPRAVGQACGANPYPVIVPCHRVIAHNGGLGGFNRQRGGFLLSVKHWLLAHEGHAFALTAPSQPG